MVCAFALVALAGVRTGSVRIHLTDGHNRPIPAHEVWLDETNSTKSVRPFGFQWVIPGGRFRGTTNKSGDVVIRAVPLRKPMMVVTRFGPRFDPYVDTHSNPSGASLDVMKFEGAVYAGKAARVVLAEDREITGTVTDAAGRPCKGTEVLLSDTGFGHMSGYPGTTLETQKTNGQGVFRFTKLPNCAFSLTAGAEEGMAVEARSDRGPWDLIAIIGDQWSSLWVVLSKPKVTCDFRITRTATLTVSVKGTAAQLKGWTAWVMCGKETVQGRELDYDAKSSTFSCRVLPGPVAITLTRDLGDKRVVAQKLSVRSGESLTVDISMADILKRRP